MCQIPMQETSYMKTWEGNLLMSLQLPDFTAQNLGLLMELLLVM